MELQIGEAFSIDPGYVVTERSAVIGQSGSGKSYLVSVICEELAKEGLGFAVIDTEGEYVGLKDYKGKRTKIEYFNEIEDIENLATDKGRIREIVTESKHIVLDVSETEKKTINAFLDSIYQVTTTLFRDKEQTPFLLVVEEADIYIPQQGRDGLEILQVISRRGRKRGLGVLFATQRPALVNKNVLSQCNNVFIGKLTLKNDIDSVRIFFPSLDDARQLTGLEPGQFYVQGTISDPSFIKVRIRHTPHGGATPKIERQTTPQQGVSPKLDLNKEEHIRARLALDTKTGKKVEYIPFDETTVIRALNSNKQKPFFGFGRRESIDDFKLLMLPIFSVCVRSEKKGLMGHKHVNFKILIDAIKGNILSPNGMQLRSKNLHRLLNLTPPSLKVMDLILGKRGTTDTKLREALPGPTVKSGLNKLEEQSLIGEKDGQYFSLYDISYPKSLASVRVKNLRLIKGHIRPENVIGHSITLKELNGLIRGLYPGFGIEREKNRLNIIYSPVLEVFYVDESTKRRVRINALNGKTIE